MTERGPRARALHAALTTPDSPASLREAGLSVLADPELHADAELVLAALRGLIHEPDPEVFRRLLPFAAHRWAGGWLPFEASPCPERGALLAEWLREAAPNMVAEPFAWPRLDSPHSDGSADAIPEADAGPTMVRAMVERLWPGLGDDDRAALRAIARTRYDRAASVRAREEAARLLLTLGDIDLLPELRESAFEPLRELGVATWLARDLEAAVAELGSLLVEPPRDPRDEQRKASLERVLARSESLALGLDPRTNLLVVCQIGGPIGGQGSDHRWQLGRFDPAAREWVGRMTLERGPESLEFPPARRPQLRFAKSAKHGAFVVEYQDRTGELLRHHFGPASDPWRHGSRAADLSGASKPAAKPKPVAEPEPAPPAKPAPAAKPKRPAKPARYEVRRVGRGPSAHEGRVAVPGQHHVGVYDHEREAIVLTPPDAVLIAIAGDHAVVWASRRRPGCSGVARGDHDWIVEIWALTGEGPLASHTVADRELIAWCWPDKLTCAARTRHRIIRLSCRSEDDRVDLYLVRNEPQTGSGTAWLETRDRARALAAI